MTFGLDGDALAAADGNGCIYLWDTDGALAASFAHPGSRGVIGVAFDPDGDLLAGADGNGRAYLWDLVSGELVRTFVPRRSRGLNDVAIGLGGDLLAAAGDGHVYLWDVVSGRSPARTSSREPDRLRGGVGPGPPLAAACGNG